jgi:hypothetical protein
MLRKAAVREVPVARVRMPRVRLVLEKQDRWQESRVASKAGITEAEAAEAAEATEITEAEAEVTEVTETEPAVPVHIQIPIAVDVTLLVSGRGEAERAVTLANQSHR